MRSSFRYLSIAGALLPVLASAQLITVSEPSPSAIFNGLVADMAADGTALHVGSGEANASPYSKLYWDSSDLKWVTGSFSTDLADLNFELQLSNQQYFYMRGPIDIGFVANENWDVNELYVNAYALGDEGNANPRTQLFDYSDNVGGLDTPPDTAHLALVTSPSTVVLEFEHVNTTQGSGSEFQGNELRFNMFRQVNVDGGGAVTGFGSDWLLSIADRNESFDGDGDDGIFYVTGDISPVPEPSQIAALALVGLGGFLFVRRRFISKQQQK